MGELGVPLSYFWGMSLVECQLKIEGNAIRKERDIFDPLRILFSKLHNVNVSKSSDLIKPKDVFDLVIDHMDDEAKKKNLEKESVVSKEYVSKMINRNGRNDKRTISKD